MMQFVRIIFGLAVSLICSYAWADKSPEKVLSNLDLNGDGKVSRVEWRKSTKVFDRIDSDHNGELTYEELRAFFGGDPGPNPSQAADRPDAIQWIDVHVHLNPGRGKKPDAKGAVAAAVAAMDANNIASMVLLPQPMITVKKSGGKNFAPAAFEIWADEARKYPERFAMIGGGGSLNAMIHEESPNGRPSANLKKRFTQRAEEILKHGAVGFGEIAVTHLSMIPGQSYMNVAADHPLMLLLADIAAEKDVVIDVHFDPILDDIEPPKYVSGKNPKLLKRNIDAFHRLLEHNRKAKISWAHAGSDRLSFWSAELTSEMLARHPNLYMSLRMIPSRSGLNFPLEGDRIEDHWLAVFNQFPDRFVLGGDQFFLSPALRNERGPSAKFATESQETRNNVNEFLSRLSPAVARKIAYENALRIYKLPPTNRLSVSKN